MNGTENTQTPQASQPLQQQLDSLQRLFIVTLIVLLFFTAAVDLYLVRQVVTVRKVLEPQLAMMEQYTSNELPRIQGFIISLQTYSKTHPDINPILAKYNLVPSTNSMFTAPAPAKSK
jgi:hypothetical protein